jgi:hypothetical protein
MARIVKPVVAELSPNIYTAAKSANLSPEEQTIVEQFSFTVKNAKRLRAMDGKAAKQEFQNLTEDAQASIRAMYPNAEFAKDDPSVAQRLLGLGVSAVKLAGSPIIATFKTAIEYGKTINTGYSAVREIQQGASPTEGIEPLNALKLKNPFANTVWSQSYNGRELYDKGAVNRLETKHGKEKVFVAKGLLAGKTPGEIVEEYGKPDKNIADAIMTAFDEPDEFNIILGDVRYAQTSPGRDITRYALEARPTSAGGIITRILLNVGEKPENKKKIAEWEKKIKKRSGFIDAFYQIIVDPLTYITGGTTKIATKGGRLAENVMNQAKNGNYSGSIKQVFAEPDVRNLWNGDLGKLIKDYADAPNTAVKQNAYRTIAQNFPGFSDFKTVDTLAKNLETFDADGAEKFFGEINNVTLLLNGRVDGVTFMRNGIATARNQRHISGGMATAADAIFNPSATNAAVGSKLDKLQSKGMDTISILKTVGEDIDFGVNKAGVLTFSDIDKDIKTARRISEAIGRIAARNPAGSQIILGEDAIKTAENFRLVARQVFNRDLADFVTFEFINSNMDEQVVILRNLYASVMYRYGLHGTAEGTQLIEEVLKRTFNNRSGMTTTSRTEIPEDFASEVSTHALKIENDSRLLAARGIVQPSQIADAIGNLPYEQIIQVAAQTRRKNSIPALFDGATRNRYVSEFVNFWTILTLFPRLGIRSAIDETFMYALSAPARDLLNFARPSVKKEGAVLTALTGSKAAVGPIKRGINKAFRKGGAEEKLSIEERIRIPQDLAERLGVPVEEITHMQIREETVNRVFRMFGVDETSSNFSYIKEAFVYHPDVLNSMASSVAARTSLGGRFDKEIIDAVFTPSTLSQALNDASLKTGRKFRAISTEKLRSTNDKWLTLAHFDTWYRQFVPNTKSLGDNITVDPINAFFRNNGLRTTKDFATARTEMLEVIGVSYDYTTRQFSIKRPDTIKKFLNLFGDSLYFSQRGVQPAEIARIHIETMLLDMRNTFHGGPKSFNEELWTLLTAKHNNLVAYEMESGKKILGKWSKVSNSVTFDEFEKATVGKQPVGEINTSIEFPALVPKAELESAWAKAGNGIMEQMDRQVTGLFRQPAVLSTYTRLREGYSGLQDEYTALVYKQLKAERPNMPDDVLMERAENMARKRYTEIAMSEATDSVLKYVDNPNVRSNLALSTRTVARFYRATEDFWRRYYRLMREKPLQVIYRMRLAHQGLSARGEIHYDENNEPYVVLPTDAIINAAVEPTMRKLTGSSFKVPQFNDITLKLRLINPSFSPDAGQPSLSGPVAALSFIGFKSILGYAPGPLKAPAEEFANEIDTFALGNLGDNMTVQRAIVPLFLQNLRDIMPRMELSRQETTAAFQAISYIQAFGDESTRLPDNPTDKQKNEYIKSIKLASHNIVAARALLGMISPISPTLRESKGVPDYIKNTGITSMRAEFYDILAGISKTESDDVFDAYELAVAMFVGKNPRKIIYTVARNERNTKVLIQKTDQMKRWSIYNKSFIDTYGEAAFVFAPQVGDYTADAYSWMESQDFIKSPKLEDYLTNVQTAQSKQAYFDIARQEEEALANQGSIPARKAIIADATNRRNALKIANPMLNTALSTGGFEVGTEEAILSSIEQALDDKSTPMSTQLRKNMAISTKLIRDFISFSKDPEMKLIWNFTDAKREKRNEIEMLLSDLIKADPSIREANRAVFAPILGFYSRDTYSVGGK